MTSTAETGHAVNVANFLTLGAYVNGFGPKYNPSKAVLEHSNLLLIHEAAKQAVKNVVDIKTSSKTVINTRADEFADVSQYATQLVNALESSDATERTIEDAKGFLRKIRGERATKKKGPTPEDPNPTTHSSSQTSFDQIIQHMEGIASILKKETSYAPNEPELSVSAVDTKIAKLNTANDAASVAEEAISNARLQRDNILYNNPDALTKVAASVKTYVKSAFTAKSPEFKQVNAINFRTYKKD